MNRTQIRRYLVWGALAVALLVLVVLAVLAPPVLVEGVPVVRGALQVTLDHEGKTRVRDRFVVSAPLPGRVLRIELEPGDAVQAGETVLAVFQPSAPVPLDERSRAEAEASVRAAQALLEQARSQRERARAEHGYAATERERIRSLAREGIVSDEQLDASEAAARALAEALAAAEAAVRTAAHELEVANARLLEPSDGEGDDGEGRGGRPILRLHSPVSGVVLRRMRESAAVVPAGEPLLEVGDTRDLEVVADFLSTDAVQMRPGMAARIERWGGEEALAGRVRRIEPAGFLKISALGVEEQRVNVIVDFADPDAIATLGDEYRVEVRVVVQEREAALKVPTNSLFRSADGWAVFVVAGQRARRRAVEVGVDNGLEAEVLTGLEEGEVVIAHPADDIEEGVRVTAPG